MGGETDGPVGVRIEHAAGIGGTLDDFGVAGRSEQPMCVYAGRHRQQQR
ncbi:MAG: hypothetical protein U5K73_11130 [Halofilum sp. (in: g-proteobacteria)]|nr:hypothetical protein [Halofilum sp. (in: g-proteobacteria)]